MLWHVASQMLTNAATSQMAVAVTATGSLVHLAFPALRAAVEVFCLTRPKIWTQMVRASQNDDFCRKPKQR